MNLLAIIVWIVLALFIIKGYRKGFVKTLASMISLVVSLILVSFATPYVTEFLETQTPVGTFVKEKCAEVFIIEEKHHETVQEELSEKEIIEALPVPNILKNILEKNNTKTTYQDLAVNSFNEYVPEFMAHLILNLISFVVTWILVSIFIWAVIMMLDVIAAIPVIHGVNQILGLGLGLVQGIIIVWIGMLVITIFCNTPVGKQLLNMIAEDTFLRGLYDSNLLLDFLQNAVKSFSIKF